MRDPDTLKIEQTRSSHQTGDPFSARRKLEDLTSNEAVHNLFGGLIVGTVLSAPAVYLIVVWFTGRDQTLLSWGSLVYCLLAFLGCYSMWGAAAALSQLSRLGRAQATVDPGIVRAGETIRFSFEQPVGIDTHVLAFDVSLVYREQTASYAECEVSPNTYDRLIQHFSLPARLYQSGETLRAEESFTVPCSLMGVRTPNPRSHRIDRVALLWVVKVRIRVGRYQDVWHEYRIEVGPSREPGPTPATTDRYDVYLTPEKSFLPRVTPKALQDLMPHLRSTTITQLHTNTDQPALLRENLSLEEAEAIRDRLAAVNMQVDIQPAKVPW